MSRIPPRDTVQIAADENSVFATMTTLFRIMAHRPTIMQPAMQLLESTMREGSVEPALKELLAIRVSQVNHCYY